jgi:cell wall-associated NlpC family hydrolase
MKLVDKKSIVKVFSIYVFSMFLGAIVINVFAGNSLFSVPFVSKSKVKSDKNAEVQVASIDHSDITGLKSITRRRRSQEGGPLAVQSTFASYKSYPAPSIPVGFDGVLTDAKRIEIRSKITEISKQFVGRPYMFSGKGPNRFDCSGYTSYVMKLFGITISAGSRNQAAQGKPVDLASAKVGDLLFFSAYGRNGYITHVGLILENNANGITIIHANGPRHGVMVENVSKSSYWKNKILFARDVISADARSNSING